jgi:hypothetical protein
MAEVSTPAQEASGPVRRRGRIAAWVFAALVVMFGLAQLIPIEVTNPATRIEPRWDSPQTRQLVAAACFDCHSNQSRHFWYEDIAPIKWWTAHHVSSGRQALDFDEWNRPQRAAGRAAQVVSAGRMPPSYYTWFGLHADAKHTAAQRAALAAGLEKTITDDPPPGGLFRGPPRPPK